MLGELLPHTHLVHAGDITRAGQGTRQDPRPFPDRRSRRQLVSNRVDDPLRPLARELLDSLRAPVLGEEVESLRGQFVIGVRKVTPTAIGEQEDLGRSAPPATAHHRLVPRGNGTVQQQGVELAAHRCAGYAERGSELRRGRGAVHQKAPDHVAAGAVIGDALGQRRCARLNPRALLGCFHNLNVTYFRGAIHPAGRSTPSRDQGLRLPLSHKGAATPTLGLVAPRDSNPDPSPALHLDRVSKSFGRTVAVDQLSLAVPRGTLFGLLGPNGAGKTTTIDMCCGFTQPDSGTIRVLGADPWREQSAVRPRIGVMLQAGGAHGAARVGEMLRLKASCAANPHDPAELLALVGLESARRTPVRRLSGGQAQRLSLAMALIGRPELLFLDEPTAGMDPQARRLVWRVLEAARADGVTIVLTTHLLDEVEALADHVAVIDQGRVIASGSPSELTDGGSRSLEDVYLELTGWEVRG